MNNNHKPEWGPPEERFEAAEKDMIISERYLCANQPNRRPAKPMVDALNKKITSIQLNVLLSTQNTWDKAKDIYNQDNSFKDIYYQSRTTTNGIYEIGAAL